MHAQRSVKRWAKRTTLNEFEDVSAVLSAPNARIWSFLSRRPCALFASLGDAALSRTHHS